ncbi:zinc finger protein 131 [Arapaima gigas]
MTVHGHKSSGTLQKGSCSIMSEEGEADFDNEFPAHYKVMLDKLNEQRQLGQFTDITLIVDGHQFRAHKAVLAACSQFFHKFFQDFTLEPLVEIEGVSNSAFRHLMEFTYTAKLVVSGSEINDVWKAAEYLQMQEAIKALNNRMNGRASFVTAAGLTEKNKAKKRKIAETSNVITESLPSVETEPVEIEVEIAEGSIEVEESGLEEVVMDAAKNACDVEGTSDDSALALLADITSKYQQGEPALHVVTKGDGEVVLQEEGGAEAPKAIESIEVVEVQISQLDNMFRCDKCERSFKLFYHLKQHMRSHAVGLDKPFSCRHCGKAYARESALKQHLNSCHFEAEEQSRRHHRPQKKVHVCEYCDKQFDHFGHFKEHLRKHTGEKPFECPDCHERFARNSTLKCHMAACQNGCGAKKGRKKLYECQVCSSVFNSWDHFKDHLVVHTGEKPNHCTMCDLWFTQPRDLRIHLREVHSGATVEEVVISEPSPTITVVASEEEAGALLEDGVRLEHVTVEPMDVEHVETMVEEEEDSDRKQLQEGEEGEVIGVCNVEEEGLRVSAVEDVGEPEVEIQVEQVTGCGEQTVSDLEVHVEQEQVEMVVETQVECEAQAVQV